MMPHDVLRGFILGGGGGERGTSKAKIASFRWEKVSVLVSDVLIYVYIHNSGVNV